MLWLLRHADAADGHPDAERPLTQRGLRQARDAGVAIQHLGIKLDACLTSPKVRAHQTAELACAPIRLELTIAPELAREDWDAYDLAAGLGDVMLVGHDPSISRALHDLTGTRCAMKKCGLAGILGRELTLLLTPRELSAIADGAKAAR